jgi:hypothetical protein
VAHLVLAVTVATGGTASHLDGFAVVVSLSGVVGDGVEGKRSPNRRNPEILYTLGRPVWI